MQPPLLLLEDVGLWPWIKQWHIGGRRRLCVHESRQSGSKWRSLTLERRNYVMNVPLSNQELITRRAEAPEELGEFGLPSNRTWWTRWTLALLHVLNLANLMTKGLWVRIIAQDIHRASHNWRSKTGCAPGIMQSVSDQIISKIGYSSRKVSWFFDDCQIVHGIQPILFGS